MTDLNESHRGEMDYGGVCNRCEGAYEVLGKCISCLKLMCIGCMDGRFLLTSEVCCIDCANKLLD